MIKHCFRCNNYGEIADPNAKCDCGMSRITCPSCQGYSNPSYAVMLLEKKVDKLVEKLVNKNVIQD